MQLRQRINPVLGLPSIVQNDKAYWLDPKMSRSPPIRPRHRARPLRDRK
jgi:hypothetical protein